MTTLDYAAQLCYSTKETLMFTYDMAVKYKDMPGVYVECGVAAGAQVIAMAYGAPNKTIYAFDSFEGIPLPSNRDDQMPGIKFLTKEEQKALPNPGEQKLESTGATSVSEHDFWHNMDSAFGPKKHNIKTVVGWFEETTIGFDKDIAILRLDGDLYNSTYVCLENLYRLVAKGGIIIIDDWSLPGCQQAIMDYFTMRPEMQDMKIQDIEHLVKRLNIQFISNIAYWIK